VSVWAVLVAAGRGDRLGLDRPKAFAPLGGRPLAAEALERLDGIDWIDAVVVAAPPGWEEPLILVAEEVAAGKVAEVVTGGETRAESVRAAVGQVPEEAVAIVVHDAARPLLDEPVVERVLKPLGESWDGAVPVLPVPDTLKRVQDEGVVETVDRSGLFTVQTPQAFVADSLRAALGGELAGATDCSALVEARGGRVRAVAGDRRLLKVTELADLELVEALLRSGSIENGDRVAAEDP
jgi:2-C-methyl-D-erythritol 4-phosphate cytidylyltransferase